MIALLLTLLLVGALVVWLRPMADEFRQDVRDQARLARLRRQVAQSDAELAAAQRQARRQMNNAVGQAWRNPFE